MASDDRKTLEQDVERDELERRKSQIKKHKVYVKYMIYIKRVFLNLFLSHIHLHHHLDISWCWVNMIFLIKLLPSQQVGRPVVVCWTDIGWFNILHLSKIKPQTSAQCRTPKRVWRSYLTQHVGYQLVELFQCVYVAGPSAWHLGEKN